jgi:hypothetical protein
MIKKVISIASIVCSLYASNLIAEEIKPVSDIKNPDGLIEFIDNYETEIIIPGRKALDKSKLYEGELEKIMEYVQDDKYLNAQEQIMKLTKKVSSENHPVFSDIKVKINRYEKKINLEVERIKKIKTRIETYSNALLQGSVEGMIKYHDDCKNAAIELGEKSFEGSYELRKKARSYNLIFQKKLATIAQKEFRQHIDRLEDIDRISQKGEYEKAKRLLRDLRREVIHMKKIKLDRYLK